MKSSMGLARNTPGYIWRTEANRRSIEVDAKSRAGQYLVTLSRIGKDRWPRKCLKEEIRNIINGNPTKWDKELQEALREQGDGEIMKGIGEENAAYEITERLEEVIKIGADQEIQADWERTNKSSDCKYYRELKNDKEIEPYWHRKKPSAGQKEAWARWRCRKAVREGKKGYKTAEHADLTKT